SHDAEEEWWGSWAPSEETHWDPPRRPHHATAHPHQQHPPPGRNRPPSYHERQSRQVAQAATIARLEAELKAERDKCVELTEKVERYREQ
ncbi:unnamed protein product, partial [Effrenium voratum]